MGRNFTRRFWLGMAACGISSVLFALTAAWPDWIEVLFHTDPDHGSGRVEWLILTISLATSLWFAMLAWREWRRIRERRPLHLRGRDI